MADSVSQRVAAVIDRDFKPGDVFTSRDIAERMNFKSASGPITGFLFKARTAGALMAGGVLTGADGIERQLYRVVDISRVRTHPIASKGGVAGRAMPQRSADPDPAKIEPTLAQATVEMPAESAPTVTIDDAVDSLMDAIREFRRQMEAIDRVDLSKASIDDLLAEVRRRMPG